MKPSAYIFDIDGTLAIRGDRSPYDYSKVNLDTPNEGVARICRHLAERYSIIIVSGREDDCYKETLDWLSLHGLKPYALYMRKSGDKRKDSIVKAEIYISMIEPDYKILGVFDDRLQVCRMWHKLGVPLFRVGDPDADF